MGDPFSGAIHASESLVEWSWSWNPTEIASLLSPFPAPPPLPALSSWVHPPSKSQAPGSPPGLCFRAPDSRHPQSFKIFITDTQCGFIGSDGDKISQTQDTWTLKCYPQMMPWSFIGRARRTVSGLIQGSGGNKVTLRLETEIFTGQMTHCSPVIPHKELPSSPPLRTIYSQPKPTTPSLCYLSFGGKNPWSSDDILE